MVEAGYEIGRDDRGLTARERQVLDALGDGDARSYAQIGEEIGGLTRQRVGAIVKTLEEKGFVKREAGRLYVQVR